jgi:hypothetical protein
MAEAFNWITFHAHTTRFEEGEEKHPDFFGIFICPVLRREPEQLLAEVLSNRNLFLAQIVDRRPKAKADDWGMNERLKAQIDEQGYGFTLTKIHRGAVPYD